MNLNFYQKALNKWQKDNFGEVSPELITLGISEECGEISHAVLKHAQRIRGYDDETKFIAEIKDGVADMMVYAMQLYSFYGINVEDALEETFNYVLTRNWKENSASGDVTENSSFDKEDSAFEH